MEGAPQQDSTAEVCLQLCNLPTRAVGLSALHRPWRGSPWLRLKHSLKSHHHTPSAGRTTSWKILRSGDWGSGADEGIRRPHLLLAVAERSTEESVVKHTVWFRHIVHQNYFKDHLCLYFTLWWKLRSVLALIKGVVLRARQFLLTVLFVDSTLLCYQNEHTWIIHH